MDEIAELQKEFRASVLASLADLKLGNRQIEKDIQELRLKMIDGEVIKDMQKRITTLEKAKTQLVTALVVVQTIFVAVWTVVSRVIVQ
jgi:hypothetical protein